jgi:hypothetical protein
VQRLVQERGALGRGGAGGVGVGEWVEHHEVVDDASVARRRYRDMSKAAGFLDVNCVKSIDLV